MEEQRLRKGPVASQELLFRLRPVAIPPGLVIGLPRVPPDTTVLADEVGLAAVRRVELEVAEWFPAPGEGVEESLELLRILLVRVTVVDIGDDMDIAAGVDDRPRRIEVLRRPVDGRHERGRSVVLRLVERTPADDRGMVEVPLDDGQPLRQHLSQRLRMPDVQAPARILAPDEIPQAVGPVEEARLENLLVEPGAVEPHRQRQLDVAPQRLLVGRGV